MAHSRRSDGPPRRSANGSPGTPDPEAAQAFYRAVFGRGFGPADPAGNRFGLWQRKNDA